MEYMKSNMPKKENTEEVPQKSPRVGGQSNDKNNDDNNFNYDNNHNNGQDKNGQDNNFEFEFNDEVTNEDEELAEQIRQYMEIEISEGRTPDPGGFIRMKLAGKNQPKVDIEYEVHDKDLQELLKLQKEEEEYLAQLEREQENQDQCFDYDEYQDEADEECQYPQNQNSDVINIIPEENSSEEIYKVVNEVVTTEYQSINEID